VAVKYERLVEEDLDIGTGVVDRTMPGGGTAVGHRVGPQSLVALAFAATAGGSQNITGGAGATVVQYTTEEFDVAGWFSTSTYKFLPDVAGKYWIDVYLQLAAYSGTAILGVYKNGTLVAEVDAIRTAATARMHLSALVQLDGVDDYVEIKAQHNDSTNNRAASASRVSAFIVGPSKPQLRREEGNPSQFLYIRYKNGRWNIESVIGRTYRT